MSEVVVAVLLAVQFNAHSGGAISQPIGVAVIVFICLFVAGCAFMPRQPFIDALVNHMKHLVTSN